MPSQNIRDLSELPSYLECLTADGKVKYRHPKALSEIAVLKLANGLGILYTAQGRKDKELWEEVQRSTGALKKKYGAINGMLSTQSVIRDLNTKQNSSRASAASRRQPGTSISTSATEGFKSIVAHAVELTASDVHFKVRKSQTQIFYRIHGYLTRMRVMSEAEAMTLIRAAYSTLSVSSSKSADFNASEPQQCSIDVFPEVKGKAHNIRLRYQHMPATGEGGEAGLDAVMRIIDITASADDKRDLEDLGYSASQARILKVAFSKPRGAVIFCGETGSGKSTSLSVNLRRVIRSRSGIAVYTIEDPVEQIIANATQVEVTRKNDSNENASNKFNAALMASLRMDPDLIMLGEIRDSVSAGLFRKVVDSGHQAVTTIHAPSIIGIVNRLAGLDIPRKELASENFLNCLVSQTLLPVLCPKCKVEFTDGTQIDHDEPERFSPILDSGEKVYVQGEGCDHCGDRGFVSRTVCAQVVQPSDKVRELLSKNEEFAAAKAINDMKTDDPNDYHAATVFYDAWMKMRRGYISPVALEEKFGLVEQEQLKALYTRFPTPSEIEIKGA